MYNKISSKKGEGLLYVLSVFKENLSFYSKKESNLHILSPVLFSFPVDHRSLINKKKVINNFEINHLYRNCVHFVKLF